ncbi:hypothetical protein G8C93_02955 [Cellulosimicrobium cellulans]|uniref:hypothetical protein n=1 Tax=Cellulosimicrobium cellulans TaxID=1710 RepID=UPI0018831F40|nr:hypothetical protein [Cellulosimicrobium cellulans]MBE9924851.1 hypothetical protein [Cellulosimicrobium cellulans]
MSSKSQGEVKNAEPSAPDRGAKVTIAGHKQRKRKRKAADWYRQLAAKRDPDSAIRPEVKMVNGKRVIKVTSSQVSAAQARVEADRRLGNKTPDWIVRISKLGPRNPVG